MLNPSLQPIQLVNKNENKHMQINSTKNISGGAFTFQNNTTQQAQAQASGHVLSARNPVAQGA